MAQYRYSNVSHQSFLTSEEHHQLHVLQLLCIHYIELCKADQETDTCYIAQCDCKELSDPYH